MIFKLSESEPQLVQKEFLAFISGKCLVRLRLKDRDLLSLVQVRKQ